MADQQGNQHVVLIVQARMGATRLPGKPLKEVFDKPLLGYLIERLRRVTKANQIVIATTTNPLDQPIVDFCQWEQIPLFRGSEEDVLDRFDNAAHAFVADVVVRVTADCPLIDPVVIDKVIGYYLDNFPKYDYVANTIKRTYPRGLDVEVFSYKSLEDAELNATLPEEREHVTPYIYRRPELFKLGNVENDKDESHHRWCVDTQADLILVTKIIQELYPTNPDFTMQDILTLLNEHPQWVNINAHIKQKTIS